MIGLAGAGDLVATALARESRNRRAGELLAAGVPAAEIPQRVGQAVEALESVPLLAAALERRGRRGARDGRARPPDLGRAAAAGVGRARARDRAAARALAPAPAAGLLASRMAAARGALGGHHRVLRHASRRNRQGWGLIAAVFTVEVVATLWCAVAVVATLP